jgi:hypothetical protein
MPVLIGLFVVYVLVTAFQMRRALATKEPEARLKQAKILLVTTALGLPLLVAFILAA